MDSFLRGNKVLPPVLAVLALLIFSWVIAGAFIGEPEKERVANQANVVAQGPEEEQAQSGDSGTPAPEAQVRDADSYAAYESKDPFRQLLTPAAAGETTGATPTTEGEDTVADDGAAGGGDRGGAEDTVADGGAGGGAGGGDRGRGRGGGRGGGGRTTGGGGLFDSGGNLPP